MALQGTSSRDSTDEFIEGNNPKDYFKNLDDSEISSIIRSITKGSISQQTITDTRKYLEKAVEEFVKNRTSEPQEHSAEAEIRRLSETYKHNYPALLDHFKKWKPCREKLIDLLKNAAHSLRRNSTCVSIFRIGTSLLDICGTLTSIDERFASSWSEFAMEHASLFGLAALLLEKLLGQGTLKNVKKCFTEDKELFNNIIQWFKQSKELDAAIQNFFPYGIDPEIVQNIERCSPDIGDYHKIFFAVIATNVKKNESLMKDIEFVGTSECFAASEAGKQWLHKVFLEKDPVLNHYLNSDLCCDIQNLLASSKEEFTTAKNPTAYVDLIKCMKHKANIKVLINAFTVISEYINISDSPEMLDKFEKDADILEKQLGELLTAVRLLKPSGMEIDPILQQ